MLSLIYLAACGSQSYSGGTSTVSAGGTTSLDVTATTQRGPSTTSSSGPPEVKAPVSRIAIGQTMYLDPAPSEKPTILINDALSKLPGDSNYFGRTVTASRPEVFFGMYHSSANEASGVSKPRLAYLAIYHGQTCLSSGMPPPASGVATAPPAPNPAPCDIALVIDAINGSLLVSVEGGI